MIRGPTSTKAFTRRYRTLAPNSQVDESLFGNPNQPTVKFQRKRGQPNRFLTHGLSGCVRVPQDDPSERTLVLTQAHLAKMMSGPSILPRKEREAKEKAFCLKREKEIKASNDSRKFLEESHRQNPVRNDLEREARDKAKRLVEQANVLNMEQEDEIKQLNQLIVGVKCQDARDRQIQEKKIRQKEKKEEERRFHAKIEQERRKIKEASDKIEEQRKQERIRGRQQIKDQIQQHQLEKQKQAELKKQEGQRLREKIEEKRLKDLRAQEKKREEQKRLQEEIKRCNAEAMHAKKLKKEQEKLADLRDSKYIQKKMQREAEHEVEKQQIKKKKDLKTAQIWAQQKIAKDTKAEQNELQARKIQEGIEREWRRTEKDNAIKKLMEDKKLEASRLDQVRYKEDCLAIETGRQKAVFQKVLKVTQEAIIKDKQQQEKQHQKGQRHLQAIQKQVQDREILTKAKRKELLLEAERQKEEAKLKQQRIEELKEKKLKELKNSGLNAKYCERVTRKTLRGKVA